MNDIRLILLSLLLSSGVGICILFGCVNQVHADTLRSKAGNAEFTPQTVQIPQPATNIQILNHGAKYPKEATTAIQNQDGSLDLE